MNDTIWYLDSGWNLEDQNVFYSKIKRARNRKLEYTLKKARVLYGTEEGNKKEAAKELLLNALKDYSDEKFDLPDIAQTLSRWYLLEHKFKESERLIDEYFKLIDDGKSGRVLKGVNPHELKAELLMLQPNLEKNIQAIEFIKKWHRERDKSNGNKKPYIPMYSTLEAWSEKISCQYVISNVNDVWDSFEISHSDLDYEIIHKKDENSLLYLWKYISEISSLNDYKISSYSWYKLEEVTYEDRTEYIETEGELFEYILQLGAYIGQVLINHFSGTWNNEDSIIKCRILINNQQLNTFLFAYIIVVYRFPLKDVINRLESLIELCEIAN